MSSESNDNVTSIQEKDRLYRLIINQLIYDGHATIAGKLAAQINVKTLSPSDRLMNLVEKGLQDKNNGIWKKSEQVMNFNSNQPILIGPDLDLELQTNFNCTAPEPSLYEFVHSTSHKGPCRAGAFSPNGQLIATGSKDASIKILDVEKMTAKVQYDISSTDQVQQRNPEVWTVFDHLDEVNCLEFHPNKPILVSGSQDCCVRLFDYSKMDVKRAFKLINDIDPIMCISFHPLGDFLLTGTNSSVIKLYDINTTQGYVCSFPSDHHTGSVTAIKYEPNARFFVSSSRDGSIKLWDAISNKCVNTFEKAHNGSQVCSVTFSRNGKYILSSGKDSSVKLWEISTSKCALTYNGAGTTGKLIHHTQALFNHTEEYVLFPDEATISLCAWNTRNASRQQLLSLVNFAPIRSIVHSPNSAAFLTCSDDYTASFWHKKP